MSSPTRTAPGGRILIVDDNTAIHDDFRKVLAGSSGGDTTLDALEAELFGTPAPTSGQLEFELVSAFQGQEAHALVVEAAREGRPFALAFVDMRMPPGWDGLETIERLWQVDPSLQVVICSAYSDHSWQDMRDRFGERDGLLILKKPFDTIEVVQCAHALTAKWRQARDVNRRLAEALAHRDRMEAELRIAHRLEAMGQLAAGIAHEINTPIQYVGDNVEFVREGATAIVTMCRALREAAAAHPGHPLAAAIEAAVEAADLGYVAEQIPNALAAMQEGVGRVASIVRAMKELAHPGPREASQTDINRTLTNALEVTAAAYRYVADVRTDFAALPPVVCYPGELSQVFLNLIVNAAHAMEDRDSSRRGTLGIATKVDGDDVVVSISDTGCGIPETNRDRVFDAFFTTKQVGRGTGQGLSIARAIVVDRHGGALTFTSTVNRGSTFFIRIPIAGVDVKAAAA